jgi:hypothetical protein
VRNADRNAPIPTGPVLIPKGRIPVGPDAPFGSVRWAATADIRDTDRCGNRPPGRRATHDQSRQRGPGRRRTGEGVGTRSPSSRRRLPRRLEPVPSPDPETLGNGTSAWPNDSSVRRISLIGDVTARKIRRQLSIRADLVRVEGESFAGTSIGGTGHEGHHQ